MDYVAKWYISTDGTEKVIFFDKNNKKWHMGGEDGLLYRSKSEDGTSNQMPSRKSVHATITQKEKKTIGLFKRKNNSLDLSVEKNQIGWYSRAGRTVAQTKNKYSEHFRLKPKTNYARGELLSDEFEVREAPTITVSGGDPDLQGTYKMTNAAPEWFAPICEGEEVTKLPGSTPTALYEKMLGGSNGYTISGEKVVINYEASKSKQHETLPCSPEWETDYSTQTAWATLTQGKETYESEGRYIFYCGVQGKWHMCGIDNLYYRFNSKSQDVPNGLSQDKWYSLKGRLTADGLCDPCKNKNKDIVQDEDKKKYCKDAKCKGYKAHIAIGKIQNPTISNGYPDVSSSSSSSSSSETSIRGDE